MAEHPRDGAVHLADSDLHIWEETVDELAFARDVMGPMVRFMRDRGWTIGPDPEVKKRHPILSRQHRAGRKGPLRCRIRLFGRHIEMEMWSEDWPSDNQNGHRYCFDIRKRMPYLTGLRCDLERRRIERFLVTRHGYSTSDDWHTRPMRESAMQRIARNYAESWHTDKELGRPKVTNPGMDDVSADGDRIEHGQIVWFRGADGRVRRGLAYVHINNMWWVVTGPWELHNVPRFEIYTRQPDNLRRSIAARRRKQRIESVINAAVARKDYLRAHVVHQASQRAREAVEA